MPKPLKKRKSIRYYKAKAGVLNVVCQPHSDRLYAKLFRDAYRLKRTLRLHGDNVALLASMYRVGGKDVEGFYGEVYKFTDLRVDDPWFNMATGEEATEDQIANISIPKHLKPHLTRFHYVFFPEVHRLIFETKRSRSHAKINVSHGIALKFFKSLLNDNQLQLNYPKVDITIEQSTQTLDEILSLDELEKLTIFVKRPNPNEDDVCAQLCATMEEQGVSKLTQILVGDSNGLQPNQDTKDTARAALDNGWVEAKGLVNGSKKHLRTDDHPREESYDYHDKSAFSDQFVRVSEKIVGLRHD